MCSYEDHMKILALYIMNNYNTSKTAKQVGKISPDSIKRWHNQYKEKGI